MILFEGILLEEIGLAGEFRVEVNGAGHFAFEDVTLSGSRSEDIKQDAEVGILCGLVEADAYHAVFEIAQVYAVFEGDFLQVADGNSFGKFDFQRIKEIRIDLSVSQLLDFAGEETSVGVDTSCYVAQSFGTVVNRIESGHSCQQRLGRTNV